MKIIIACAGNSKRFSTGKPKHIEYINGEPNINRTINILNRLNIKNIKITVSEKNKFYFENLNIPLIIGSCEREIDRYRNIFTELEDKTIILYGDVVYDIDDLCSILSYTSKNNIFFGRLFKNKLTKKPHGEIFGVIVNDKEKFIKDTNKTAKLFEEKKIQRELGWDVYRVSEKLNLDIRNVVKTKNFLEVSDMTDDFDTYQEYEIIKKIYENKK